MRNRSGGSALLGSRRHLSSADAARRRSACDIDRVQPCGGLHVGVTRVDTNTHTHTLLTPVMTMQGTILSYGAIRVSDVSGWGPHSLMNAEGEVHHPAAA